MADRFYRPIDVWLSSVSNGFLRWQASLCRQPAAAHRLKIILFTSINSVNVVLQSLCLGDLDRK